MRTIVSTYIGAVSLILPFLLSFSIFPKGIRSHTYIENDLQLINIQDTSALIFNLNAFSDRDSIFNVYQAFFDLDSSSFQIVENELWGEDYYLIAFEGGVLEYYDESQVIDIQLYERSQYVLMLGDKEVYVGMHCSQVESAFPEFYDFSVRNSYDEIFIPFSLAEDQSFRQIDRGMLIAWDAMTNEVTNIRTFEHP